MPRQTHPTQKNLTANKLTLVDAAGKTRILLDAGGVDGYASIWLFGKNKTAIELSTQPNGTVVVALKGPRRHALLSLNTDGDSHLSFTDRSGRKGLCVGSVFEPGTHKIVIFRKGQVGWEAPAKKTK